ncbi:MAG: protein-glutamate O-methyltransferase [Gammaproteobacteria bacterium]|nr:protein-glutamate O-methyltransferase [Gammaproteobacteria bacterium]
MSNQAHALNGDREFHFTESDFAKIRTFVKEQTGINLSDAKKNLVYGRLTRRLRELDMRSFKDYLKFVQGDTTGELVNFINAITTNLTSFFRENHHFEFLKKVAIPGLIQANQHSRRLRIWSAGCSTGEEPYSIAIALKETIQDIATWDVKILATDLDTNVLAKGKSGVYDEERIAGLSDQRKRRWFRRGRGDHSGTVRIARELGDLITFNQLNLMKGWPMKGPFDLIFCRNVVIYFDKETQRGLFDRYAEILRPDGYIFLGHSESMFKVSDRFNLIGNTIYQRIR